MRWAILLSLARRYHPQYLFRDKNRRDRGESQSKQDTHMTNTARSQVAEVELGELARVALGGLGLGAVRHLRHLRLPAEATKQQRALSLSFRLCSDVFETR
eukprot:COSAG01_NODE_801_length_13466_cov_585.329693_6_plen_101_part_00